MVVTCSAFNCPSRRHKGSGIRFYGFPLKDKKRCQQWVAAVRRLAWKPSAYSVLCSRHFEDGSFRDCNGRRYLRENVVPTKFDYPKHLQKPLAKKRLTRNSQPELAKMWDKNQKPTGNYWRPSFKRCITCLDHSKEDCSGTEQTTKLKTGTVPSRPIISNPAHLQTGPIPVTSSTSAVKFPRELQVILKRLVLEPRNQCQPEPHKRRSVQPNEVIPAPLAPQWSPEKHDYPRKPQRIAEKEVNRLQTNQIPSMTSFDHQYYARKKAKPNVERRQKENIQRKNPSGVSTRNIASVEDFHVNGPTIVNVFSYPQGTPFLDFEPAEPNMVDINHPETETCKKCQAKYRKLMRQKDRRHKAKLEKRKKESQLLRKEIKLLKKEIGNQKFHNYQLAHTREESNYDVNRLSETQRRLVVAMFKNKMAGRCDPHLLNDSLQLKRISRAAYHFVKKKFELPLPSEVTLRRYLANLNKMVEGLTDDGAAGGEMPLEVCIAEMDTVHTDKSIQNKQVPVPLRIDQNYNVPLSEAESSDTSSEDDEVPLGIDQNYNVLSSDAEQAPLEVNTDLIYYMLAPPVEAETFETSVNEQEMTHGIGQTRNVPSEVETTEGQVPLEVNETNVSLAGMETLYVVSSNANGNEGQLEVGNDDTYYVLAPVEEECNEPEQISPKIDQHCNVPSSQEETTEVDGDDQQVPLEVSETSDVLATIQEEHIGLISSNANGDEEPLEVDSDQIYYLVEAESEQEEIPLGVDEIYNALSSQTGTSDLVDSCNVDGDIEGQVQLEFTDTDEMLAAIEVENGVEQEVSLEVDPNQTYHYMVAPVEAESGDKKEQTHLQIDDIYNAPSSEVRATEVGSSNVDGDSQELDDTHEVLEVETVSNEEAPVEFDPDQTYYMLAPVETESGDENDQSYVLVPVENYSEVDSTNSNGQAPCEADSDQTSEAVSSILGEQVFVVPT